MNKMSLNEGYLMTFDFRKNKVNSGEARRENPLRGKELKQKWVDVADGRKIFDVIV